MIMQHTITGPRLTTDLLDPDYIAAVNTVAFGRNVACDCQDNQYGRVREGMRFGQSRARLQLIT